MLKEHFVPRTIFPQLFTVTAVFFVVLSTHFGSQVTTTFDSAWTLHTAMSILKEGNIDLDEYKSILIPHDYRIQQAGQHFYYYFPIGTPILTVPFLLVADRIAQAFFSFDLSRYFQEHTPQPYDPTSLAGRLERLIASCFVAATAVIVYLITRRFLTPKYALLLVFIFAFCTGAWSTASRGLWQHGPSMLMLVLTLYLLLKADDRSSMVQFAALPLAMAYVVRPTNSVAVVLITVYVFLCFRRYFLRYLCWAAVVAIPFLLLNLSIYQTLLPPYYLPQRIDFASLSLIPLMGNLISPSRGLFVFSPVLLFAVCGVVLNIQRRKLLGLNLTLAGIIFLHWITISSYWLWYGGWSIGARFFTDMIPFLIYFLIPIVDHRVNLTHARDVVFICIFISFTLISFAIDYRCSTNDSCVRWNLQLTAHQQRLWDWNDLQFLRGLH